MADYLSQRECLRGLVLVMDVRHPLKDYDRQMLDWTRRAGLPAHILLTKADKLGRGPASAALHGVRRALEADGYERVSMQLFSAPSRQGVAQARGVIGDWLEPARPGKKKDPGS
jgi:GTP-binding protein